ncbi:MAG: HD domain-containing protein [Defluviitaleaceae bacterium]|nr:HD domain-containing protein [Defluviitaleaceae bacterium]
MYDNFLQNPEIAGILDAINNLHADNLVSCHGRGHALAVVRAAEYVLRAVGCDSRVVEMGKVAAVLHDIGNIAGRWEHAKKSAGLARVFLKGSDLFSREEIGLILQAIEDHSDGENISSAIGAAVIIGDKTDLSRRRIFPYVTDPIYKNLMEMTEVDLKICGEFLTVNFIVTQDFSREFFILDFVHEYKKGYELTIKAAEFLGRRARFQINGDGGDFDFSPAD